MKIQSNEYSSNNAKEFREKYGIDVQINNDLVTAYGASPSDFVELARGKSYEEFVKSLPYSETIEDNQEALNEAWQDINAAESDLNEWFQFIVRTR
jgi:hypothetical protein